MIMTLFIRLGKNPKIHIQVQKVPSSQNNHAEKEILAATQYRVIEYVVEGPKSLKAPETLERGPGLDSSTHQAAPNHLLL